MSDNEKKKGPVFIILILLLILTILLVAVGAAYYFLVIYDGSSSAQKPIYKTTLDTYTVNLADNNFRRYIRLTVTLEYDYEKLSKEIEEKKHRINDAVISYLTTKRAADMTDKEVVRQDLEGVINSILTSGQVTGLYFEEFIIQ